MLYNFIELKEFVERELKINTDSVNSSFKIIKQTLTNAELDTNIGFINNDIYLIEKNGNKHKGFLYIESGYSKETIKKAKTSVPKFHVLECSTIKEKKRNNRFNGYYVFSNNKVEMEDRYDGITKELTVCGNCLKETDTVYRGMKTSEFCEKYINNEDSESNFRTNDLPKEISTDFWGYTPEWHKLSSNYRTKKLFTCEGCGIKLNNNYSDGFYLETHHLDGNTLNNEEDNLRCLCVLCHANIDKYHQENYSRGHQHRKLRDFINLFEDELRISGNKYLKNYK